MLCALKPPTLIEWSLAGAAAAHVDDGTRPPPSGRRPARSLSPRSSHIRLAPPLPGYPRRRASFSALSLPPPAATAHARPAPDSGAPSFSAFWWSNPHPALRSQRGKAMGLRALGTRRVLIPGQRQGSRGTDATNPCLSVSRVCRHHLKA